MELNETLTQEAIYWCQKSRVTWLQDGERNTKFFHTSTLIRRRRNAITRLKLIGEDWCTDLKILKSTARDFFVQLYTMEPCSPCNLSDWAFHRLTHSDRHWLNRPISDSEIYDAVFQMGALKASGPDDFPPGFFQQYWHIVGNTIIRAVRDMFDTSRLSGRLNASLICLIPKGKAPDRLSQFRPISLCNVLVKVVSKILANRLKPLMAKLTGLFQASFIPGRSLVDNVIVAQELIHSLQKKTNRKGGFVLKVNLEKAYDRVHWPFLQEVLKGTDFKHKFVSLIFDCVTSTSLSVCWNGECIPPFSPSRGLRQGDPLSPYLFVLCMEIFSQQVSRAVERKEWAALRCT